MTQVYAVRVGNAEFFLGRDFWPENGRFWQTTLPVLFGHDSEYRSDRTC